MAKRFRDWGIRPKGSYEIAVDPCILMQVSARHARDKAASKARSVRASDVFKLIVKIALEILPPEQRRIFYSVWVRSGGRMNKGVMEYSRKIKKSHFTSYNNYYKALASIQDYLRKSGYEDQLIKYLGGMQHDEGEWMENNFDDIF